MPSDPKWMRARDQARAFYLAARRCNEAQPLPSGLLQFLLVPSLVNYAFSIEVGLKALALNELGTAPKGHDLKKLLRALPANTRDRIMADSSWTPGTHDPAWTPQVFESSLDLVREVFEVWRYIYEQGPRDTDLGFLQRLSWAVQKALESLPPRPSWA
jgi:hypothetical protein